MLLSLHSDYNTPHHIQSLLLPLSSNCRSAKFSLCCLITLCPSTSFFFFLSSLECSLPISNRWLLGFSGGVSVIVGFGDNGFQGWRFDDCWVGFRWWNWIGGWVLVVGLCNGFWWWWVSLVGWFQGDGSMVVGLGFGSGRLGVGWVSVVWFLVATVVIFIFILFYCVITLF